MAKVFVMTTKTLFLAWQDKEASRQWFPIGRLDADVDSSEYRFRYTEGAKRAEQEVGFPPLLDFPTLEVDYRSSELFPLFRNRVMWPGRPDFADYLKSLDLPMSAGPIDMLSVNGGYRATDSYEVFPKLIKNVDGSFVCQFSLHGWRYVSQSAQERLNSLEPHEELYLALELTNPVTKLALQIQTTDYYMIGWAPRYLVFDLTKAMAEAQGQYSAKVVRVNTQPATSEQRVLVEMCSTWKNHEPMSSQSFVPLVE